IEAGAGGPGGRAPRDAPAPPPAEAHPRCAARCSRAGPAARCWGAAASAVPRRAARTLGERGAPVPGPPAAGVPVPPVGQVAALVRRPGDQVLHAGADLLIAAGAAGGLVGRGNLTHHPVPVRMSLYRLHPATDPLPVDRSFGVTTAVVATRAHPINGSRGTHALPCDPGSRP